MLFSVLTLFISNQSNLFAQIGKCKGKYLGNIIQSRPESNYNTFWNQATSENASKWGSVEGTQGNYNWTESDAAYNWAKNNGGIFKYHCFVWGQQAPTWVDNASVATLQTAVENYIKACSTHYTPMGGLKMIDVLNEPVNTAFTTNYKDALIAGYKAEPANAGDLNNQYGWAIWPFQLARKYFPEATLLINEYNIEHNWNNCRTPYIAMINAIKNAPNLTDGSKNLIDGVGLQCHSVDGISPAVFKSCIDEIWTKTGVPIHITEFDVEATPDEATQTKIYSDLIPVAWEHPRVAGITFWGYIQGTTWRKGNNTPGPSGTDTGILYSSSYTANPLGERPAMAWLKNYFSGKSDLTCCPPPAPFADCSSGMLPTISIDTPANDATFALGEPIVLTATAADADGTITGVEYFQGNTLLGSATTTPYTFTWNGATDGFYTLTAVATDNLGNKTISNEINIVVGNPTKELLSNGEFDNGTSSWILQNNSTGVGSLTVVTNAAMSGTNALKICPTTPGTADWHVQLQQAAPLEVGKSYKFSFIAKADAARNLTFGVQQNSSPYSMYYSNSVSLTTNNQSFNYNFIADTTDASSRLKFFVGNNSSCVYLDKVSFQQIVVNSLNDNLVKNLGEIYPNPFANEVQINVNGQFDYYIQKLSGEILDSGTAVNSVFIGKDLAKGLYLVKIKQNNLNKVYKINKY